VHLGADRILVIGVRNELADGSGDPDGPVPYPSFAEIAGYTLDTLFMDGLYSDLERLSRINQLIDSVPAAHRGPKLSRMRPIDTMVIVPSEDLRVLAHRHREALPVALRSLLWGISGRGRGEGRLLSYLMFEQGYTRELIELGYRDAMRVREQLEDFVAGKDVPRLFAPHWVEEDLDILHA
jgi:NTE family protein